MIFITCHKCGNSGIHLELIREEKECFEQLQCLFCGIAYDKVSLMKTKESSGETPAWVPKALNSLEEDLACFRQVSDT